MDGGDKRLEANAANDLFESAVVAVRRNEECANRDLRRIFEIFARETAQTQSGPRGSLQQKRSDVRLLLSLAAHLDRIVSLDLDGATRLLVDEPHKRGQKQIREDDKPGGNPAGGELPGPAKVPTIAEHHN